MIQLFTSNQKWNLAFLEFKSELENKSTDIVDIQHIGSTAIDQLKAKDIVDVQVAISSFDKVEALHPIFQSMGLEYIEAFKQDHVPFKGSDYFSSKWEKRFFTGSFNEQRFNIHVRLQSSHNWNFALDFVRLLSILL